MSKLSIMHSKGHYINGMWSKGNGTTLESVNPAYGTLLWQGTNATDQEIAAATQAARQALPSWSGTSFEQRAHYIKEFAQQVEKIEIK